ncbi:MAG: carboxypeptidase-like regulatory domain-containing protein [Minicystis sp.]
MARTFGALTALGLILATASGCGPHPEKAGDECDIDDGCPNQLVCAAGTEDNNICYNAPGAACVPADPDYCLGDAICTDKKICEIPLGGKCDPAGADNCQGEGTCDAATKTCQLPAGAACDPAGKDYCAGDLVCGETDPGMGTCGIAEGGTCDPAKPLCAGTLICAELQAGGFACYPPVVVTGMVFDAADKAAVAGAQVIALDAQATAITDVAVSDAMGNYKIDLPVPRGMDGAPIPDLAFTLRASASGYQTFPGGLRTALPIKTSVAVADKKAWVIDTTLTDISLIGLPAAQKGLPSIAGKVVADQGAGGVLVVAEGGSGGISAVTDKKGGYTIFNVPDGAYTVRGYAAGLQLTPAMATVAGKPLTGVDLTTSTGALGKISGSVNIVNAPGGSMTSVVLVVKSTFSDTFVRGEVPRGLRTPLSGPPSISGGFTIDNVPEGEYIVLAAFENDNLVRDPDPNIAGTQIVSVQMPSPGTDVALSSSFKITEALAVVGPGATDPEPVTTAPKLRWADDSSEEFYTVVVYNAYGELVWCLADTSIMPGCAGGNIPKANGGEVSVDYGGPMDPGMYYQFRATSWRAPGGQVGPIAQTEDLRGVFYVDVKQ